MSVIKELRKIKNMSQKELADILFVNQTAVSQWERGVTTPNSVTLKKLSELFNVSIDYILGNDTSKPAPINSVDKDGLNERDRKDIAKDMKNIREKLINKEDGPVSFDGENISEDDTELLLDALEMMLKRVKKINKEKYNPNKNKK